MEILYQNDQLVVVDKPAGMLVHKTGIASDVKTGFALQTVRDMIGKKVFPVHRLDRPTSGVLLFALDPLSAKNIAIQFTERTIIKEYICVVRGYTDDEGIIDIPLSKENGSMVDAKTSYSLIRRFQLPIPNDRFETSRYSIVRVKPESGRMHQIRRHFAKKRWYLIGDTTHGNLKANRAFGNFTGINRLLLHAEKINLNHPITQEKIYVCAPWPHRFVQLNELILKQSAV
ncbi:MAG: pseudouridine synthase [Cyclobacteriaceae bacterium]